jgi:octaprenyl-diphosphate synthase
VINYKGQEHIQSGVILEYVFAATKFHNDTMELKISCQDEVLSQGLKGTDSRILVGDFFYSRAFYLMAKLGKMPVVSYLCNAINQYVEGQTLQIDQAGDPETSEAMYFERLKRKSGLYFASIAQVVGVLGDCTDTDTEALCDYAMHLGMALQIIEETLSCIRADETDQHKQANLPFIVIRGLNQATPELHQLIQSGIEKHPIAAEVICQICMQTDAIAYARTRIESDINQSIQVLQVFPESINRQALQNLATDLLVQFEQELAGLI